MELNPEHEQVRQSFWEKLKTLRAQMIANEAYIEGEPVDEGTEGKND